MFQYDVFISYKQKDSSDLAILIKDELLLLNPNLKIFLDRDDVQNISKLEDNVKNSSNFILIITKEVFESYYVKREIKTALDFNKNIILIHDQENCHFPNRNVLEPDMQQIFDVRAIPYIREYRKIIFTNILSF